MKLTTTIALLACALLSACGGGDDVPSAPVDVWQVPAGTDSARTTCAASYTALAAATAVRVTVETERSLRVAAGSVNLRAYALVTTTGEAAPESVSLSAQQGITPAAPLDFSDADSFWIVVPAGQTARVEATAAVRGQVEPGAVLTTNRCRVSFDFNV